MFRGHLYIGFKIDETNNINCITQFMGDWKTKLRQITKKPRNYTIIIRMVLDDGSHISKKFELLEKATKTDIKLLCQQAMKVMTDEIQQNSYIVDLEKSYILVKV